MRRNKKKLKFSSNRVLAIMSLFGMLIGTLLYVNHSVGATSEVNSGKVLKHSENVKKDQTSSLHTSSETFTIVISTFDRDAKLAMHIDHWIRCPNVHQVQVVWHDPEREIPPLLEQMEEEYDCDSPLNNQFSKKICDSCPQCSKERLWFRKQTIDVLTNRFRAPPGGFETEAIFSVDDDFVIDCRLVNIAFERWKNLGKHALVGFEPRIFDWNEPNKGYQWNDSCQKSKCYYNTIFLTKGGFINKLYFDAFFEDKFTPARNISEVYITGEDMLMSFVHFVKHLELHGKAPRVEAIQVVKGVRPISYQVFSRRRELKNAGLLEKLDKPLKRFQQEGDGNELSGRTGGYRPLVRHEIGALAKKLVGQRKLETQTRWIFMGRDSKPFTSSNVCKNEELFSSLRCTQTNSIHL